MGQRPADLKLVLHDAIRAAREHTLSRLEGLSEYDLRRPMTPTGTNLLGVVKHLGGIEYGYLGQVFGRSIPEPIPGDDDFENNGDMWARPDESRQGPSRGRSLRLTSGPPPGQGHPPRGQA